MNTQSTRSRFVNVAKMVGNTLQHFDDIFFTGWSFRKMFKGASILTVLYIAVGVLPLPQKMVQILHTILWPTALLLFCSALASGVGTLQKRYQHIVETLGQIVLVGVLTFGVCSVGIAELYYYGLPQYFTVILFVIFGVGITTFMISHIRSSSDSSKFGSAYRDDICPPDP